MKNKILLFLTILTISTPTFACKFIQSSISQQTVRHPVVFKGKIIEGLDDRNGQQKTIGKILVEKSYKGVKEKTIYPITSSPTSCGLSFDKNQTWLIFGNIIDNTIHSSSPDGSFTIDNSLPIEVLQEIEKNIKN